MGSVCPRIKLYSPSHPSSATMIFVSLFPTLFHLFILMCFCSTSVKCFVSCPAKHLINSLIPSEMLNPNATTNKSSLCDCTSIQEGGWEITCFTDLTSSGNNEFSEVFPSDYGFTDYNALSQAFNVKYEARRFIEISCDKYAPRYKPAMFQGKLVKHAFFLRVCLECQFQSATFDKLHVS